MVVLALVVACAVFAWPSDSPLEPRNAGHPVGDPKWAQAFLACAAGAMLVYGIGLLSLPRHRPRLTGVAALAVAIQLAPLGAPLLISTDAWTYWDYGRIAAVDGGNPYRDPPAEFANDPAFPHIGEDWRDTTSVYGPAFTLASEPLARAAGSSPDAAAWIFKSLAALAVLLATGLAVRLARDKAFACAFAGWNPVVALHAAGGGHNDAWVAALVLGALVAGAAGRRWLAGAAWAAAVLVKWVPVLFLPLRLLEARATGRRVGHAGFAVALLVICGLATWRYGIEWLKAFGPLAANAAEETSYAIPHRLQEVGLSRAAAVGLCAVAFAVAYALLLRQAAAGRARLALTGGLFLLATPWLAAWYTAWVVPLAAAEEDRAAQLLAFGLCAYLLPQAVPV
ncbi:MAG TPA: glycosyltransferase 87 family protein [Gaiellaceae bacterium]|nr:glycosyltransferase 87 family protein [Gaiellaceae bacterium]